VLEVVGAGGMGVVLVAWDPELERRVASSWRRRRRGARARARDEGRALAGSRTPTSCRSTTSARVDDRVFLVMELDQGRDPALLPPRPRPPTVPSWSRLYRQCADGLAAAHAGGLIHRDFKPDNAILGADGRVRVLDFGLARDGGATGPDAVARRVARRRPDLAGTPRYMAPEQRPATPLTAAVDQFALGVALRESLVGAGACRAGSRRSSRAACRRRRRAFPSMDALLAALALDPMTRWRAAA
jgi:serine/threonine protein kinase